MFKPKRKKKLILCYSLLKEGYTEENSVSIYKAQKDRIISLKSGLEIKRSEIKEAIKDSDSISMINFYLRYKKFGFPHSCGFANQVNKHIEIIEILERLDNTYFK